MVSFSKRPSNAVAKLSEENWMVTETKKMPCEFVYAKGCVKKMF